ncbi:SURF1 family protein [uncultured Friedmanniella sp.]|uniref:SURF1 family protein n=1 Tax=uncultured Friedmanniella sp. TaxID=335381 RepID=UPI0035CBD5E6
MIWLRQLGVILVGLVLAGVMVVLGIWQLDVYHSQGRAQSERRAAEPAVPLASVAQPAAVIGEGYGRQVTFSGHYLPGVQLLVTMDDPAAGYRVVSALQLDTGGVLPVVRGVVGTAALPTLPSGTENETGVLLPSEEAPSGGLPAGQISSVRIPTLAQQWPGPLLTGYVTLPAADATRQGLSPAPLDLPESSGRLRNGAYALQWWVFAAFAVGMAVKVARDQRLGEEADDTGEPTSADPDTDPAAAEVLDVTTEERARAT